MNTYFHWQRQLSPWLDAIALEPYFSFMDANKYNKLEEKFLNRNQLASLVNEEQFKLDTSNYLGKKSQKIRMLQNSEKGDDKKSSKSIIFICLQI